MPSPCEQEDTIKEIRLGMNTLQEDIREAFSDIKESMKQQTNVLVGLARSDEKINNLFHIADENRKEIDIIRQDMKSCVTDVRHELKSMKSQICKPSGVKLDGERSTDGKFDKTQISLIIGAVTGFLTFIYTLVNKLLDHILTGVH